MFMQYFNFLVGICFIIMQKVVSGKNKPLAGHSICWPNFCSRIICMYKIFVPLFLWPYILFKVRLRIKTYFWRLILMYAWFKFKECCTFFSKTGLNIKKIYFEHVLIFYLSFPMLIIHYKCQCLISYFLSQVFIILWLFVIQYIF